MTRSAHLIDDGLRLAIRGVVAGNTPWPLFVHGSAGLGKTCAALAMLDHAPAPTDYYTATGWAEALIDAAKGRLIGRGSAGSHSLSPLTLRGLIDDASLVALDELATRDKVSDWHYDCVKELIDRRHGKPLVVLSNLDVRGVASVYDDRIADRLAAGTVVALRGASRRGEWRRNGPRNG